MVHRNKSADPWIANLTVVAFLATSTALTHGQGWLPADATIFDKQGTVAGAPQLNVIPMITKHKAKWLIHVVPGQSEVKVVGTAATSYLHTGLFVKFSGEIDDAGSLRHEIKELEIFTPAAKSGVGVFASGAGENAKPIGKLVAGTYDVRGKIVSYQNGNLQIVAVKKISGKVSSDAKIAVNVQDISLAQADDALAVKGWFYKGYEPAPSKGRPAGKALGKMIEIKLAKPLTVPPQKGPLKPTKQAPKTSDPVATKLPLAPKEPIEKPSAVKPPTKETPAKETPTADPNDVFGFDKEK